VVNLLVVRHAQAEYGQFDGELTDAGQRQAQHLATWVRQQVVCKAVFSSDMRRAAATAACFNLPIPIWQDTRLREYRGWTLDGQPCDLRDRPASPEIWMNFSQRVLALLDDVSKVYAGQTVLWITHGGIFDVLMARLHRLGSSQVSTTIVNHTGVTHYHYEAGRLQLHYHNQLIHLPPDLHTF
jgi:broad specificity phosphatase PhoE